MAFLVSPGVQVREIDLTNVVPAVSASIGGFAGAFNWGPVEEIRTVSSEKELASVFGTPTDSVSARSFLTAASFLKYGNALKVVRAAAVALNATSGATAVLIKNRDQYDVNYLNGAPVGGSNPDLGNWAAKHPGVLGNSLEVSVCPSGAAFTTWVHKNQFASAPGISETGTIEDEMRVSHEMHVAVIDSLGKWSGSVGTVLEKFEFVSQAADAVKEDGSSNYYVNRINDRSEYVYWLNHLTELADAGESLNKGDAFDTNATAITKTLVGGTNATPSKANVLLALDLFADSETEDVSLLFSAGDADGDKDVANYLISICNARKDCIAFVSPPIEATVANANPLAAVKAFVDGVTPFNGLTSSSYAMIDSTALKVYDKYNDVYRNIPACGHIAGLCAATDANADAWFSPAGLNRGQLLGVTKLHFNPKQADRDTLYKARVNPIVSFPGQGTVLFGDKTALAKPSAFDRINVRRLFIVLEKSIATAAKFQLFELNDEFTRASFLNLTEPFLRDVQGRRGITDFKVVCDESNNTGDVIDRNEFRAEIFIKPARSINFISLNFIATRTGVEFTELAGAN